MKLFILVLALSCTVAYTTARKKGQYWPTNTKIFTTSHRFRREADPQDSVVANLKEVPQLLLNTDNENIQLDLIDNELMNIDHDKDVNDKIPDSRLQPNAVLNNIHQIDENDYLSAYTFHPGAYGGFAQNFGTGGGFRWRREADALSF